MMVKSFHDGTTTLTDLNSGEKVLTFGKAGGPINLLDSFSPDGKRLLAMVDNSLRILELPGGKTLITLPSAEYGVNVAIFSPLKEQVALGMGPVVKIVDENTGQILVSMSGHTGFVQSMSFNQDGTRLATAGADSLAYIWNTTTGQALMTLAGHSAALGYITFDPGGNRVATAGFDGTVRLWDVSSTGNRGEDASFDDPSGRMYTSIAYSPDGSRLAVSGGLGPGGIFDALTGQPLISLRGKFSNWQGSAAFSPDGSLLATTSGENDATLWDAATGQKLRSFSGHTNWIGDLAFSPDGKRLATISFDGSVKMWDTASGNELYSIHAFDDILDTTQVLGIDFSPDGSRFATAAGPTPKIWDANTGKEILSLAPQQENVYSVAFSPDGKTLAIGVALGVGASTWDVSSGRKLTELIGHQGSVNSLLFSRDGRQVITGSVDGTIKVWDVISGQELLTLTRQSAQITGLALSPDGKRLAASSDDGTARVFLL